MRFKEFNKVTDIIKKMTKCDEDTALDTTSAICKELGLEPEETEDEIAEMFVNLFEKIFGEGE